MRMMTIPSDHDDDEVSSDPLEHGGAPSSPLRSPSPNGVAVTPDPSPERLSIPSAAAPSYDDDDGNRGVADVTQARERLLLDALVERQHRNRGMLPRDMYSLLLTAPPSCGCGNRTRNSGGGGGNNGNNNGNRAFVVACTTVAVQTIVLLLIAVDSLHFGDRDDEVPPNNLRVPPTSEFQVSLAQFLALTIAALTQYDVVQAILLYYGGLDEERFRAWLRVDDDDDDDDDDDKDDSKRESPVGRYLRVRWYASLATRFSIGFATMVVTFMLVAQSETVRDVMLDFTAIEFVSALDEVVFVLAAFGFFGRKIKRVVDNGIYDDLALTQSSVKLKTNVFAYKWMNGIFMFLLRTVTFWVNIGLLMFIVVRQYTGKYVPDTLLVQLGDERSPLLSTYSGIYDLRRPRLGVLEYVERGGDGLFTWCESERAWTFLTSSDLDDCANDWSLKSTEIQQYADMLTIATEPWYIVEENNIKLETQHFRVFSMRGVDVDDCHVDRDRDENEDFNGIQRYGWTCRFANPCPSIAVDAIAGPLQRQRTWPTTFDMLPDILVYRQPVYYYRLGPDWNPDLIFFTGRQWVMLGTSQWLKEDEEEKVWTDEEIYDILRDFRVYRFDRNLGVRFLSESVDLGTKTDRGTPVGLRWFAAQVGDGAQLIPGADVRIVVEQQFYCAVCNEELGRSCLFGAPCVDGVCMCDGMDLGSRCEVVPSGNGVCNPSFNNPEFDFDGGDCCSATCVDSENQACLRSDDQLIDYGNSLCRNRNSFFERRLPLTQPDFVGEWPNAVSVSPGISLTADGRTFAASYRLIEQTSLVYKVGNTWTASGIEHSFGGYHSEIVSLFPGSVGGPVRRLPVKGVSASYPARGITCYVCNGLGCDLRYFNGDPNNTLLENTVVPTGFPLADYWDPFAVSSDGTVLARGEFDSVSGRYFVDLYTVDSALGWILTGERIGLTINRTIIVGSYLAPALSAGDDIETPTDSPSVLNNSTDATVPACQFLAERCGLTVSDWSSVSVINNFPLCDFDGITTDEFVSSIADINVTDFDFSQFNVTRYIWEECIPELIVVPVTEEQTSTDEAPIYLSLSRLRPDGSLKLAVGSIAFGNRSAGALSGSLATRVYEISADGRVEEQGTDIAVIDQSTRHGKSGTDAIGIPKKAVTLSDDGDTLVVNSLYQRKNESGIEYEAAVTKIFRWNVTGWHTIQEIDLGRNDTTPQVRDGWSSALSADGTVLAVAFPLKSAVYRWNGTHYGLNSTELAFASGTDVAVSLNGATVGFAAPLRGGFGAFMYRNDMAPWCSRNGKKEMRISYTPLAPQNFTWQLFAPVDDREVVIEEGGWRPDLSLSRDPLSDGNRKLADRTTRDLQLDVEVDYALDDPTGLTFAYTVCVGANICEGIYNDVPDDLPGALGVIYDGRRIRTVSPVSGRECRLEFSPSQMP